MHDGSVPSNLSFVRPCLAELFRTCVYPPSLALRIEKVLLAGAGNHNQKDEPSEHECSSGDEKRRPTYRLILSDGVLVVQALLESRLILLINPEDVVAGSTIVLKRFRIQRAKRLNGQGKVVFLGIADCHLIPSEPQAQQTQTKKRSAIEESEEEPEGQIMSRKRLKRCTSSAEQSLELKNSRKRHAESVESSQDSDSDDFETIPIDRRKLESNRQALHELNVNQSFESQNSSTPTTARISDHHPTHHQGRFPPTHQHPSTTQTTNQSRPRAEPSHAARTSPQKRAAHQASSTMKSTPPPPAHPTHHQEHHQKQQRQSTNHLPLLSLLTPPTPSPKPTSPFTLFALISWISPSILAPRHPHSPFPAKRHIKIHDPSISGRHAGVTVAVFCDAANFRPRVGTVALFRGLTLQRIGAEEVILNAYERLMREETKWFEDDELVLQSEGWDVWGMRRWWEGRSRDRTRRGGG